MEIKRTSVTDVLHKVTLPRYLNEVEESGIGVITRAKKDTCYVIAANDKGRNAVLAMIEEKLSSKDFQAELGKDILELIAEFQTNFDALPIGSGQRLTVYNFVKELEMLLRTWRLENVQKDFKGLME